MCVIIREHKFPMFTVTVIYEGRLFAVLMLWMHVRMSVLKLQGDGGKANAMNNYSGLCCASDFVF